MLLLTGQPHNFAAAPAPPLVFSESSWTARLSSMQSAGQVQSITWRGVVAHCPRDRGMALNSSFVIGVSSSGPMVPAVNMKDEQEALLHDCRRAVSKFARLVLRQMFTRTFWAYKIAAAKSQDLTSTFCVASFFGPFWASLFGPYASN